MKGYKRLQEMVENSLFSAQKNKNQIKKIYIYTSGCHKSSIPLAGSDLGIIRLVGFSLGETI